MNLQEKLENDKAKITEEGKYVRIEDSDQIVYLVKPEFRRSGWREFLLPYEPYRMKVGGKEAIAEIDAFPPLVLFGTIGYVLYEAVSSLYGLLF